MRFSLIFVYALLLCLPKGNAQTQDLVKPDSVTNELHKDNVGRIVFVSNFLPIANFKEEYFLKKFELRDSCDFDLGAFMDNSLTNYLHRLDTNLTADELVHKGNYQFSFYVDQSLVYVENLNTGARLPENKNTKTAFRVPLISTTNEDSWGRFMWLRFMLKGGEDAFSEGTHHLKIELRSYLKGKEIKVGNLIAKGEIDIAVTKPVVSPKQILLQPIAPGSGFEISKSLFDKKKIEELNKAIVQNTFKNITSIVVIKNGKLLLEEYFNGANRKTLQDTRSVGKSFASALTGIAIRDGFIKSEDEPLSNFYKLRQFANYSPVKDSVTIKDLLTMSSAFNGSDENGDSPGNEENMYPTTDWVKFTLDLPMDSSKSNGKQWDYFTAGVNLLGAILHKSIPGGLEHYAQKKIFQPLAISKYEWQYTPQRVVSTAGGLRMASLDFAKFGQLYQNKGAWSGHQILPAAWVEKSLSKQIEMGEQSEEFYGFLFWNKTYTVGGKKHEAFYCSGNGGNKIFIFNDLSLVVVITATAYNQPYAHSQVDKIMQRFILPAIAK